MAGICWDRCDDCDPGGLTLCWDRRGTHSVIIRRSSFLFVKQKQRRQSAALCVPFSLLSRSRGQISGFINILTVRGSKVKVTVTNQELISERERDTRQISRQNERGPSAAACERVSG